MTTRICHLKEGDYFRFNIEGAIYHAFMITDTRLFYYTKKKPTLSVGKNSQQFIDLIPREIVNEDEIKCVRCMEYKPKKLFHKDKYAKRKYKPICNMCRSRKPKSVEFPELLKNPQVWNGKKH